MKKTLLFLAGILISGIVSFADSVDRSKAESIAARWLGCEVSEVPAWSDAFFVFNGAEGGWIIVSAEDSSVPVLGYSDTGAIDPDRLPSNFRHWTGKYAKDILSARSRSEKASLEVTSLWKTAGYRTKAGASKLLKTASWGQDSPYNDQCPTVEEKGKTVTAVTGCVATAMSEVIRYHQWPAKGTGTIGGYTYTSDYKKKVTIDSYSIDSHTYDYSLMPMSYSSSSTSAQKAAVAQLMHDCGVMVEAAYNYETGTGAYSENIANALINHMSYSASAQFLYRQSYTDAEWTRLIESEIDADRPLIYAGGGDDGGHQFVCDGYDSKDYIHINWGWEGSGNGYFTLELKIPGSYSFPDDQSMIIGLEPDPEGDDLAMSGPLIFDASSSSSKGFYLCSGTVLSKSFKVGANAISNIDYYRDYSGAIKVALVDYRGNIKEWISEEADIEVGAFHYLTFTDIDCAITGEVTFGDRVVLYYKTNKGEWEQVKGNNAVDYTTTGYPVVYLSSSIPAVDAAFILVPDTLSVGDTFYFELVQGSTPIASVVWYYDTVKQSGVSTLLTSGIHTVTAEVSLNDGSSETITAQIIVE